MDQIVDYIITHSAYAPWITFGLLLLAGLNVPISIDIVLAIGAFLAATIIPEQFSSLLLSMLLGCYLSAWLAYWMGRIIGRRLLKIPYFSKLMPDSRLQKIQTFYQKHGLLTLVIGRFIPFGMRNCIFMTTGLSHSSFFIFMRRDAIACSLWTVTCFCIYYQLSHNYTLLIQNIKKFNLIIILVLGVTGIAFLCYNRYKKKRHALIKKPHSNLETSK